MDTSYSFWPLLVQFSDPIPRVLALLRGSTTHRNVLYYIFKSDGSVGITPYEACWNAKASTSRRRKRWRCAAQLPSHGRKRRRDVVNFIRYMTPRRRGAGVVPRSRGQWLRVWCVV